MFKINLNKEEKFIINTLFSDKKITEHQITSLNFEKLIKIASSHLILPSLYVKLKEKNYLQFIPNELNIFLKKIYSINHSRNKELIAEIKEISELFRTNKISHVFLKGSSLVSEVFEEIGERMVGDIDILVKEIDFESSINLLKSIGYNSKTDLYFFNQKHYPRLLKKNKLFAVEIHNRALKENKYVNIVYEDINQCKNANNVNCPNNYSQLEINIYNDQINDNGYIKESFNFKSFYDTFMIVKKFNLKLNNIKKNKYTKNYLCYMYSLGILTEKINDKHIYKKNFLRHNLKKKSNIYYKIDFFVLLVIMNFNIRLKQLYNLLINKEYRDYAIKKIINQNLLL
tara:strand:- start:5964 stop:6992 length:1029 start_codon:yes stop_codon:yes gene_type:complete